MGRKRYETPDDRKRQAEAMSLFLARTRRTHLIPFWLEDADRVDCRLRDEGRAVALIEVKCRRVSAKTFARWGTYMLDEDKWEAGEKMSSDEGLPFGLLIRTSDGRLWFWWSQAPLPEVHREMGGRDDRGDPDDEEMCVWIPWGWFREIR